jgi:Flp pilus assembly protein TadG
MSEEADNMKRQGSDLLREDGFALVYMAAILTGLLLFTGLAVDSGRSYVVKAQLSKAVDGAALAAARNLNGGDPQGEAARIFKANFADGYMGTSYSPDPTTAANFFNSVTDAASGVNIVTVTASTAVPTSFMRLGGFTQVTVSSSGQATRRMVDLSVVLDVSSSIGSKWGAVRDATRTFVNSFDAAHDRVALMTFSNGATVLDPMPPGRGFNKAKVVNDVPQNLPGGSTLMVEGLYRAWDELRSVPAGTQSGLRIIVLFTDGASNGVPGDYEGTGTAKSLRSWDFPKNVNDPDGQTWDQPHIDGLYDSQTGNQSPSYSVTLPWNSYGPGSTLPLVPFLPLKTMHTHHRSAGIPIAFDLQSSSLTVNKSPQTTARGLRHLDTATGRYPAEIFNINNAARNVLEIIGDAARNDAGGDYKIRIYTLGMSYLVEDMLGTMPEMPEDILKRISNDPRSPDHNSAQLDGEYFYAPNASDVGPAFQGIQNRILRLSK